MFHVKLGGEGGGWAKSKTFAPPPHKRRDATSNTRLAPAVPAGCAVARLPNSEQGLSGPSEFLAAPGRDQRDDHTSTGAPGRTLGEDLLMVRAAHRLYTPHKQLVAASSFSAE